MSSEEISFPIALTADELREPLDVLRSFCKHDHPVFDAKLLFDDWLQTAVQAGNPDPAERLFSLANHRFVKKELYRLVEACFLLKDQPVSQFGFVPIEFLLTGNINPEFLPANVHFWNFLPHSLTSAEIAEPLTVIMRFFQFKTLVEWRAFLDELDDVVLSGGDDFFEIFSQAKCLLQCRNHLFKLLDVTFLLLLSERDQ